MTQSNSLLEKLNTDAWRARTYLEIIEAEIDRRQRPVTVLEIGCGRGFDNDIRLQHELASRVDKFVGLEPDMTVEPQPIFSEVFRENLEDAGIPENSIDVAFSIMVMEHVENADAYMHALASVLKPGGVYWGFTVDSRHWFTAIANWMSHLHLKSLYLSILSSAPRGEGRYLDYPTAYKLNRPEDLEPYGKLFSSIECWNVGPVDSAGKYAPRLLRPLVDRLERTRITGNRPRTDFVVRIER